MMIDWHKYPLVRIILAFFIGITCYVLFPFSDVLFYYIIWSLFILFFVLALIFNIKISYFNRRLFGVFVFIAFVFIGFLWSYNYDDRITTDDSSNAIINSRRKVSYTGIVISDPVEKAHSYQAIVKLKYYSDSLDSLVSIKKNLLLYFSKDSASKELQYGDEIIAVSYINTIDEAKNPNMFNYKKYLRYKKILIQGYVSSSCFRIIGHNKASKVKQYAIRVRDNLLEIFIDNGIKGREFALATALIIGYDDYLESPLREAYSGAGVMHVLCVSGLHVGIVFLFISFLFNLIAIETKWYRVFKVCAILFVLWIYAFVTGLAPAVFRAVLMFSFVVLGDLIDRKTNIYNTLAASAFVLVLINPFMIFYIGFQMSYLAVVGIVFLQPKIYHWVYVKNYLLDKIWSLVSVSIAAQLFLAPLLVYAFHKVSLLFFISNIFAIPLATLILYFGYMLLLLSWMPVVSHVISFVTIWLIKVLNSIVFFISDIYCCNLTGLWISTIEMLLIYCLLAGIIFTLISRKTNWLMFTLFSFIMIFFNKGYHDYYNKRTKNMIFYHVNKSFAANFSVGRKTISLYDSTVIVSPKMRKYNIDGFLNAHDISSITTLAKSVASFKDIELHFRKEGDVVQFCDKTVLFLNDDILFSRKCTTDYLIVEDGCYTPSQVLVNLKVNTMVVFTNRMKRYGLKKWKDYCNKEKIPYYSIPDKGAFIVTL